MTVLVDEHPTLDIGTEAAMPADSAAVVALVEVGLYGDAT